jgi:hypothetical protein
MKKLTIILLTLYCLKSFSQNSSYAITSSNDTIYVDKFNILNKKIKLTVQGIKKEYNYEDLVIIYDFKNKRFLEKISPAFFEYKQLSGNVFFAERLTEGKVKIYRYLTNEAHIPINTVSGNTNYGTNRGNTNYGTNSGNTNYGANIGSSSFNSYFIGLSGSKPEFLCYYELQMSKNEYKLLKLYLHSNDNIQKEIEDLFFSEIDKKEKSVIELVNKYNLWASTKK